MMFSIFVSQVVPSMRSASVSAKQPAAALRALPQPVHRIALAPAPARIKRAARKVAAAAGTAILSVSGLHGAWWQQSMLHGHGCRMQGQHAALVPVCGMLRHLMTSINAVTDGQHRVL